MSQSPRKPQLSLIPTVVEPVNDGFRDPRLDEGKIFTDEQGRKLVMVDGQLHPMRRPGGEIADLLQTDVFDKIAEVVIDRTIQAGQVAMALRMVIRDDINAEYADSWWGKVQCGWAKRGYDHQTYHPQRKEFRVAMTEMMTGLSASQNAMVATLMGAYVEQNRRSLTDPFEMADHLRDWTRYTQESSFEDARIQEPINIANAHELAKIDRETARQVELARVAAETQAAEQAAAAAEADKNRSFEVFRATIGMTTEMNNAIAELRLIEQQQPTAQVTAAMEVLRATMDSMAVWGNSLDEETKKRMAPYIAKMAGDAINQAMRAARRG